MKKQRGRRACELCERTATVYCDSDSAFLCSICDAHVHAANFLAARHVRRPICRNHHEQFQFQMDHTLVQRMSKEIVPSSPRVCLLLTESDDPDDYRSSSSSSSCISSSKYGVVGRLKSSKTEISRRNKSVYARKLVARMELVVSDWCRTVLPGSSCGSIRERVEKVARDMVRVGVREIRNIPLRCVAAAAVWMVLRKYSGLEKADYNKSDFPGDEIGPNQDQANIQHRIDPKH